MGGGEGLRGFNKRDRGVGIGRKMGLQQGGYTWGGAVPRRRILTGCPQRKYSTRLAGMHKVRHKVR
jgi:hypothetical protein